MPALTVVAGPNGAGKSTLTLALSFEGRENLLDPDRIARQINPSEPRRAAVAAGRAILELERRYLAARITFAVEATLAGRRTLAMMRDARGSGFEVYLLYVAVNSPEICVARILERTLQGGQDVPEADVLRRYHRSLENAPEAILLAGRAVLFDNSSRGHRRVLEVCRGSVTWQAQDEPAWSRQIRRALVQERA